MKTYIIEWMNFTLRSAILTSADIFRELSFIRSSSDHTTVLTSQYWVFAL